LDFGLTYGATFSGFIHVHHLQPLGSTRSSYLLDPIRDLRPVCPNCHAVMHRTEPPLSPEAVKELLRRSRGLMPEMPARTR
jgi:5-methylcytosine-specific restriction protein A